MKATLIGMVLVALSFALGFWFGRYPITQRRLISFWARRREAMRRHYYE